MCALAALLFDCFELAALLSKSVITFLPLFCCSSAALGAAPAPRRFCRACRLVHSFTACRTSCKWIQSTRATCASNSAQVKLSSPLFSSSNSSSFCRRSCGSGSGRARKIACCTWGASTLALLATCSIVFTICAILSLRSLPVRRARMAPWRDRRIAFHLPRPCSSTPCCSARVSSSDHRFIHRDCRIFSFESALPSSLSFD
mmetsp:Transcript_27975/g.45006  ORF Transcript_27975/g.45006 Transcript_27975/m.45006 type:complete len:202 (+) Transcript_27975:284-889(+)